METIQKKITDVALQAQDIRLAAQYIKEGALVAFPTETVYGLGGNGLDPEASAKIYAAKGRPSDNPLILHICDMAQLEGLVVEIPEAAKQLAEAFWPGPLTMIFRKAACVPYETTGGLETVAVRMPNHPVALALIRESGVPIAAPSANTSGRPSPTLAAHVFEDMNGKIPMILDGGAVGIGIESTIVDLTEEKPMVLRPGYINRKMLEDVVGEVILDPALLEVKAEVRPKAPGMKYRHYAPKAELAIVKGAPEAVAALINEKIRQGKAEQKTIGVICTTETLPYYKDGIVKCVGSREHEEEIAQNLFRVLREFDAQQVDAIYSEELNTPMLGWAVMNRLGKAAAHKVIEV